MKLHEKPSETHRLRAEKSTRYENAGKIGWFIAMNSSWSNHRCKCMGNRDNPPMNVNVPQTSIKINVFYKESLMILDELELSMRMRDITGNSRMIIGKFDGKCVFPDGKVVSRLITGFFTWKEYCWTRWVRSDVNLFLNSIYSQDISSWKHSW